MAAIHQRFVYAYAIGPIAPGGPAQILMGTSELCEVEKYDLQTVQELLMKLRRKSISFFTLGTFGESSGPEFSRVQMEKAWEDMKLGHKFQAKKDHVRAFILSGELSTQMV